MAMAAIATAVAIKVATNVLTSKILGEPDQPAQIGSGTSPSTAPGDEGIGISPVEGSTVTAVSNPFEEGAGAQADNQAMILQQLEAAGVSPADLDQYGIAGMAVGGYLKRGIGGSLGIADLLPMLSPEMLESKPFESGVDFSELAEQTPEDMLVESMFGDKDVEIESKKYDEYDYTLSDQMGDFYNEQDPMVQDAVSKGVGQMGTALLERLLGGGSDRSGSLVSTKTLPGNSNRRRSSLEISPVSGSSVTFANQGSALQRPMFMPNGGAMHGPGGPRDDLIPVMASNGEYMLSKAAVDAAGDGSHAKGIANLERFNEAGNKRYG
tara:strand:- start:680 stop:1651 length:972 start_codon:yes stop_codon:yes gene_type:complete